MRCIGALPRIGRLAFAHPFGTAGALDVFSRGRLAGSLRLLYWYDVFADSGFDIIHCHFGPTGIIVAHLKSLGVPGKLVTTFHGYDAGIYPHEHGAGVYRELFRRGDLFTVNTEYTLRRMTSLGCPPERTVVLPMSVDTASMPFRERTIGPDGRIVIVTVARLVKKKGIDHSIRAFARAAAHHPGMIYRIIGEGPERGQLECLIGELGLAGRVEMPGALPVEEIRRIYDDSHILLLASVTDESGFSEGQGVVLQEAQACGLPVIATAHESFREGVVEGESAVLVPERDTDALAGALESLASHPGRWPAMGRAGRTFVEGKYNRDMLNDRLVELYRSTVSR